MKRERKDEGGREGGSSSRAFGTHGDGRNVNVAGVLSDSSQGESKSGEDGGEEHVVRGSRLKGRREESVKGRGM